MDPKKKGFSLKWGLIGIVALCWLLPLMLTLGSVAFYATHSMRKQFNDSVHISVTNAAAIAKRSMGYAVAASRTASYEGSVRAAYSAYLQDGSRTGLHDDLNSFLVSQYRYDDNFLAAMLFLTDEPDTVLYTLNIALGASYADFTGYRNGAHEAVRQIANDLDTRIGFYTSGENVYMIRNIVDNDFKPFAVIVMQLNVNTLLGSFGSIVWQTGATVFLNGVPVSVNTVSQTEKLMSFPEGLALSPGQQFTVNTANSTSVYGRESIDAVEILYAVEVDTRGFLLDFLNEAGLFYLLLFASVPLLGLAVWFFYRNIFIPVNRLSMAARAIQDGDLGYKLENNISNREFAYLTEAFNAMSARLKQQFERIYSEELALRDARIMALQSQINPHFLNNTLEIINWEARLGNNTHVSKMIEALSTMLDAAMSRKSSPLVSLAQEMMYVDAYLYIISERFGKRLVVEKEIDSSLLQYEVPRLIMQPIIENAVEHGVTPRQTGLITIKAYRNDDRMVLEVQNNTPMSEKDAEIVARLLSPDYDARSEGSLHLGIHNVNQRLKMIYGEKYGLSITSDGASTISSMVIPMEWRR